MISTMRDFARQHAKNFYGWKTKRKIVVISVDDYGNVRLDSKEARSRLEKAGLKAKNRFDNYDALENADDLSALFDTLSSVKDKVGRQAVFTPFVLPCNLDFERIESSGYEEVYIEPLPATYAKLKGYEGTWDLWQEGMRNGLLRPQFHGREHLNLKVLREKMSRRDEEVLTCLKNRSYSRISTSGYSTISYTAAFEFWNFDENSSFASIIAEGLEAFQNVFGYRAVHFNSPGGREHKVVHKMLHEGGIKYIDAPWIKNEHQGNGRFRRDINYCGKRNDLGQLFMVRNVVFEPTEEKRVNWVELAMRQIETAFYWSKPAIISSHRVNFTGQIDSRNRDVGISSLKTLLKKITKRWPDVEFLAADELASLMAEKSK